jgi:hypothetical protein
MEIGGGADQQQRDGRRLARERVLAKIILSKMILSNFPDFFEVANMLLSREVESCQLQFVRIGRCHSSGTKAGSATTGMGIDSNASTVEPATKAPSTFAVSEYQRLSEILADYKRQLLFYKSDIPSPADEGATSCNISLDEAAPAPPVPEHPVISNDKRWLTLFKKLQALYTKNGHCHFARKENQFLFMWYRTN